MLWKVPGHFFVLMEHRIIQVGGTPGGQLGHPITEISILQYNQDAKCHLSRMEIQQPLEPFASD